MRLGWSLKEYAGALFFKRGSGPFEIQLYRMDTGGLGQGRMCLSHSTQARNPRKVAEFLLRHNCEGDSLRGEEAGDFLAALLPLCFSTNIINLYNKVIGSALLLFVLFFLRWHF